MEQEQRTKKIFIVNDDKLLLEMYATAFKSHGFEVVPAFGSIDAIEKLRGGIVSDVVLFDLTTSILDSFELLKIIRSEKLIPAAKIVVFSTTERLTLDEESRALGIHSYLSRILVTPVQAVQEITKILDTTAPSIY